MIKYFALLTFFLSLVAVVHAEDKVVKASDFGFDAEDATAALQGAIDSGARKVIVDNVGKTWFVNKIKLVSHQEIFFEKGVVVQAKRGAFKGRNDSLFTGTAVTEVSLMGAGATLKMWKEDYDDTEKYAHAEWRNVLAFRSSAKVRIEGLTLADSGGDGIYLGVSKPGVPCSDFVIKDVICDNNYRQGISVISARNLLIENTVLKNTGGTAPSAGIDFEPNAPTEELTNCVMRNCVSENNEGMAYHFYLRHLSKTSKPVSIRLENCRGMGGPYSVNIVTNSDDESSAATGTIDFVDCVFERGEKGGIYIADKPVDGAKIQFTRCKIVDAAPDVPSASPIAFANRSTANADIGNVRFEDCTIAGNHDRKLISYQDLAGGFAMRDIFGNLTVDGKSVVLTEAVLPLASFKKLRGFPLEGVKFEPVSTDEDLGQGKINHARLRHNSDWLIWAKKGERVGFSVLIQAVGKGSIPPAVIQVESPSGTMHTLEPAKAPGESEYTFAAEETGAYRILCQMQRWTATVRSKTHHISLYAPNSRFRFLSTTGEYFFWVPAGTKEFAIRVAGDGDGERVKASLCSPTGEIVQEYDNIVEAREFLGTPKEGAKGEIWSLRFDKPSEKAMEDFVVRFLGVPPVLSHTKESLLKPSRPLKNSAK